MHNIPVLLGKRDDKAEVHVALGGRQAGGGRADVMLEQGFGLANLITRPGLTPLVDEGGKRRKHEVQLLVQGPFWPWTPTSQAMSTAGGCVGSPRRQAAVLRTSSGEGDMSCSRFWCA
ncbi:hypothetical protein HG531_009525 [Fusarium graminearum]|nr:hypothetical protein HG531_009525 [Fusarium graminearum]